MPAYPTEHHGLQGLPAHLGRLEGFAVGLAVLRLVLKGVSFYGVYRLEQECAHQVAFDIC